MALRITVSVLTAVLMVCVGLFWMFVWLVGTNGYSEAKGGAILAANLVLVLVSIVGSAVGSGWLAGRLAGTTAWSPWVVGPLAVAVAAAASLVLLVIGSLITVFVVGS